MATLVLRIFGWRVTSEIPAELKKFVVIAAPHTSGLDFPLGILARSAIRWDVKYIGKKSLFDGPLGWFFRWSGGYPVDRSKPGRLVDQVIAMFDAHDKFAIALAPEGTRKKVDKLRSGFYHIAKGAGVPVVMAALDYGKKSVDFSEPFYLTGDMKADMAVIWKHFAQVQGRNRELGIG